MFKIDKSFSFCYGHRVWTQLLNGAYSKDMRCSCRHLHGHEATVTVFLEGDSLNEQGMVTDFRHLQWLKDVIDKYIDHKFIADYNDPLLNTLLPIANLKKPVTIRVGGSDEVHLGWKPEFLSDKPDAKTHREDCIYELYEGVLIVGFVPTSENLSKWMHGIVSRAMAPLGVKVSQVDWWETPKSRSSYVAD